MTATDTVTDDFLTALLCAEPLLTADEVERWAAALAQLAADDAE